LSIHEPCRAEEGGVCIEPNAQAKAHIANGIRITNSDDVTISGTSESARLKFQNLSTAILVESDTSNTLTFANLRIEGMTQYGIWVGAAADDAKVSGVTIANCDVQGAYGQHGFRIYANHVTVTNCTACRCRDSATGLWVVQGKDIDINGFQTDNVVFIGPNHQCDGGGGPEKGERLMDAKVNNINADYVEVTAGVIGCWLTDLTAQTASAHGLTIGTTPGGNTVARPTNRVHWSGLQGNTSVGIASGCAGSDISACVADVDDDNDVDTDDLIAVILGWGPCAPVGACWFNNLCHPHWTASACASAGGVYQGDGTDCWTHPADAPCCRLNITVWTCEEKFFPRLVGAQTGSTSAISRIARA
jgi:hypothetical protein